MSPFKGCTQKFLEAEKVRDIYLSRSAIDERNAQNMRNEVELTCKVFENFADEA